MKFGKIFAACAAAAMSISMLAVTASAEKKDSNTAVLCISAGGNTQWKSGELAGSTDATITGDGQYTVTAKLKEATASIELILISTDIDVFAYGDGTGLAGSGLNLKVDSVKVDGNAIAYNGPSEGAFTTNDDGTTLRMNILNTWGNSVSDIASTTAESEISVTFTITGLGTTASADTTAAATTTTTSAAAATTTTSAAAGTTTTAAATTTTAAAGAAAGDAGVAVVVATLALAGAAAFAARKKD